MERRVQYAVTPDGVNIAFSVAGEGPPLIHVTPVAGAALSGEQLPGGLQYTYSKLAEYHRLIRIDIRGTGLSDREIPPLSTEGLMSDILAVMDRLELEESDIFAVSSTGPAVLALAAEHPERVRRMVLWCTSSAGRDIQSSTRLAIDSLATRDWNVYTETISSASFGWGQAEDARRLAALLRETTTPEGREVYYSFVREMDVTELLPKVTAPSLVVHFRDYPLVPAICATRLAAQLPDADIALFDGNSLFPQPDDLQMVVETVDAFLGGPGHLEPPPRTLGIAAQPTLRTILFTDIEGSTALTQRLGDLQARQLLRQYERITRQALADHGGAEVKALGDGFLTWFDSASKALECAVTMQQSFESFNRQGHPAVHVRIGINAGEPIADGQDIFGTAVNLTARIAAAARGTQVLVSDVVRQLVAGKGFLFTDQGEVHVRGYDEPVRLHELRWRGRSDPDAPAIDPWAPRARPERQGLTPPPG